MTGIELVREFQIAATGARRALAVAEKAVADLNAKAEAFALAFGQPGDASPAIASNGDALLTADDVAGILRVSKATLARWRVLGTGPGYVKKQGRILYRAETVEKFVISKERTKTRDEARP
ncbi:helix-turn-helix domain-containing protein [Mesorhizobium sp.]|uniref:helix-turn-helix transcriptional regulator n=1 Tax=Mesorhizobium sp. TaxID=1871066 RepID=UPI0012041CDB|nr:helix-turn-helix domain-containing protein [Mesorhizobium sp.]TIV60305.1 MAG: helix-turn-helix domain-containing protein [Mesorhizobium sp.]